MKNFYQKMNFQVPYSAEKYKGGLVYVDKGGQEGKGDMSLKKR